MEKQKIYILGEIILLQFFLQLSSFIFKMYKWLRCNKTHLCEACDAVFVNSTHISSNADVCLYIKFQKKKSYVLLSGGNVIFIAIFI